MATEIRARGKGPKLPAILVAKDLPEGVAIFRTAGGRTPDPSGARIADTAEVAELRDVPDTRHYQSGYGEDRSILRMRLAARKG